MDYKWAVNKEKLSRAIAKSPTKDEKEIMSLYILLGGLVVNDNYPQEDMEAVSNDFTSLNPSVPKKRGRPTKKK